MAKIEFAGLSSQDTDNRGGETQRLVNCYPEPLGYRSRLAFKSVLGMNSPVDTGELFCRAMQTVSGKLYACAGPKLVRINKNDTVTTLGTIKSSDFTTMASMNGKVLVCAGGKYYVQTDEVTDGRFSRYGSVTNLGQRVILTKQDGREFQWSDLADPASFPGLNFATAEGRDDNILRAEAINGNLWLFKERSVEVWYDTGEAGADAFVRLSGGVIDTGLKSFGLLTTFDGGAFFVGDDGIAYITSGAGLQPVSIPALETAIAQGEPDRCFFYTDEGHKFCVIRFADRPAWVYDLSTKIWHERSSGVDHDPWQALCAAEAYGRQYAGDFLGKVHRLVRLNKDGDTPLKRTLVSKTITQGGDRFRVPKLELYTNMGQQGEGPDGFTPNAPTGSESIDATETYSIASPVGFGENMPMTDVEEWEPATWRAYDANDVAVTTVQSVANSSSYTGISDTGYEDDYFIVMGGTVSFYNGDAYISIADLLPLDYTSLTVRVQMDIGRYSVGGVTSNFAKFQIRCGDTLEKMASNNDGTFLYTHPNTAAAVPTDWTHCDSGDVTVPTGQTYIGIKYSGTDGNTFRNFRVTLTGTASSLTIPDSEFTAVGAAESGFRPPRVMARFSRDYGRTWGREEWRSLGDVGEYDNRVIWRSLGQQRQLTMEFSVTDPVEVPIYGTGDIQVI